MNKVVICNLLLILSDDRPETEELLSVVASHYEEIQNEDVRVMAIMAGSREQVSRTRERLNLRFAVL